MWADVLSFVPFRAIHMWELRVQVDTCCPGYTRTVVLNREGRDYMKIYKVWIEVEEIDEENDSYSEDFEGSRLPEPIGEFNTPDEAYELVDNITRLLIAV